jgi:uncharacterized membrane protein YoaK (UPF0700 family)
VFVQYVSQNVNYTSAIILKRVLKSKVELAIGTVIFIFLPTIYTLFRSLMSTASSLPLLTFLSLALSVSPLSHHGLE